MPSLIVDYRGSRRGGIIPQRVLIGRLPTNGICLLDSHVSRLHAWIENDQGRCYIADVGSLSGTTVNDAPVGARQLLKDNDVVCIGPATIIFRDSDHVPYGILPIELQEQPPSMDTASAGILFNCECGAPHWVKANIAGRRGQCHRCREQIIIPSEPGAIAQLIPSQDAGEIEVGDPSPPFLDDQPASATAAEAPLAQATPETNQAPEIDAPEDQASASDEQGTPWDHTSAPIDDPPAAIEPANAQDDSSQSVPREALDGPVTPAETKPLSEADLEFLDAGPATAVEESAPCSICRSAITADDAVQVCPECHLTFHTECWQENLGCSAYGCGQVGVLDRSAESDDKAAPSAEESNQASVSTTATDAAGLADEAASAIVPEPSVHPDEAEDEPIPVTWDSLFLLTAVVGVLASAFTFGTPSLVATMGTTVYLFTGRPAKRRGMALAALALSVVGTIAGACFSYFWLFHVTHHQWK